MSSSSDAFIGLLAAVASGVTGSAFTVPTRKEPELGWLAIQGWCWEQTWFVFNVWNILINLVLAASMFGLKTVLQIYAHASRETQLVVVVSSALWAAGTLLFGKGVEMGGVALGVGLAMTSQIIFGTALPFINDPVQAEKAFSNAKGPLVVTGIIIACLGFAVLGRASYLRDHPGKPSLYPAMHVQHEATEDEETELRAVAVRPPVIEEEKDHEEMGMEAAGGASVEKRLWLGVLVSLLAGLFSALLQFAFIYGAEVIQMAEAAPYRASPLVSSAVIFTVSTAINNAVQAVCMALQLTRLRKWDLSAVDEEGTRPEVWQNVGRCFLMAAMLNMHIELYGASQAFMGEMGPVVAWPLIMSLVVLMSQVWGHVLNEWQDASKKAAFLNWSSIAIILSAVFVLGISARFD